MCDLYAASDDRRMRELKEAGAQAVFIADSWASCDIISPAMFERFALPYQRLQVEAAQRHGLKAILWNEGDVRPILHHEAALPVDAFAVEQPRKGIPMSLKLLRDAFGSRCRVIRTRADSIFGAGQNAWADRVRRISTFASICAITDSGPYASSFSSAFNRSATSF